MFVLQHAVIFVLYSVQMLTPRMARLSLSSVALRDGIVHGLPVTGRELGERIDIMVLEDQAFS